jgi:phosphoglycolate phosphatase-like HAD superfamily hydrolase
MKDFGLRVAVASSASKTDLTKLKGIAMITDLVEEETSKDDADKSKPSPDIFQATLQRLQIDPSQALALGDTPWDIQAAAKAGISTVAVASGGWKNRCRTALKSRILDPKAILLHLNRERKKTGGLSGGRQSRVFGVLG